MSCTAQLQLPACFPILMCSTSDLYCCAVCWLQAYPVWSGPGSCFPFTSGWTPSLCCHWPLSYLHSGQSCCWERHRWARASPHIMGCWAAAIQHTCQLIYSVVRWQH